MKTLTYILLALLLSANVFAVEIPNQFEDGQVTSASQMNENFQALKAELEAQRALIEANLGNHKVVFQGFSAESMDGGQGMLAMQQACHNLVPGSHVCKDTEIALSPYNPNAQNLEGSAWVLFELGSSVAGADYTLQNSPISFRRIFSQDNHIGQQSYDRGCGSWNWNTNSWRGAIVDSQLKGNDVLCSTQQKVACCK
jgi:hypothetical protein